MKMFLRSLLLLVALSVVTAVGRAQQTGFTGKVTDAQGAAISGATVDVLRVGGAVFHATTNAEGVYLVPSLVAADYEITASASGFTPVKKPVTLLVGQLVTLDLQLPVSSTTTSIVVEAESLAIDTTSSVVAGNVTPQEVQGVPINGRNYMSLATLVPGIKINAVTSDVPVGSASESGKFMITMDGLQVSQDTAGAAFGQPRFSQDAISQFQIITNRFDATLGRSAGVYVNSQSKSGSNSYHGGAFGYFRNDSLNAPDPVAKKVLPFSDQQFGGTMGGPIKKDKLWFFGSYEGERKPDTATTTNLVTNAAFSHPNTLRVNEYLGRGDYQINATNRIFVRGDGFTYKSDYLGVSGNADPSRAYQGTRTSYGFVADWNSNLTPNLVNDLHGGYHHFGWQNLPYTQSMEIIFSNITVGGPYNYPQIFAQNNQDYRDDLFWLKGKHSVKFGAEYIYTGHGGYFQQNVRGRINPCSASITAAQYNSMFPNGASDASSWNYTAINSVCGGASTFIKGFGDFTVDVPRSIYGFWFQDDWKILPRLTLNLGVRYDNDFGAFTGGPKLSNGLLVPQGNDNNNFAPRIGFAWDPMGNGKTNIRGGAGLYFADISANQIIDQQIFNGVSTIQASVSGTAASPINFSDPFKGGNPAANPAAYSQAVQPLAKDAKVPYALQLSFGVQRELPWRTVLNMDFVHTRAYDDWIRLNGNFLVDPTNAQRNLNPNSTLASSTTRVCGNGSVSLDTISSYSSTTRQVCNQSFTSVSQFFTPGGAGSIYDGLQMGIKHSTTAGFTGALAYTWARTKNSTEGPFYYPNKPFASGIKDEWGNGTDDQRHSLTLNGEYKWKYGLSLSSLFRFGSGLAFATATGTASPNGGTPTYNRTVAAGTTPIQAGTTCAVAPCLAVYAPISKFSYDASYGSWVMARNAFRGRAYERIDSRLQEAFPIGEKIKGIVAVEVFNLFNHFNPYSYNTNANSSAYGTPTAAGGSGYLEFAPRQLQFIGRISF
ncbi:TonB-dependent receptor [Terriglobus albidus]|nr:carboxypeptidase regulatory-like domain-containing protein [Terriglobus albidus]